MQPFDSSMNALDCSNRHVIDTLPRFDRISHTDYFEDENVKTHHIHEIMNRLDDIHQYLKGPSSRNAISTPEIQASQNNLARELVTAVDHSNEIVNKLVSLVDQVMIRVVPWVGG